MIKLSNLADYAIVIMTTLSAQDGRKLNALDVSTLTGVPQATAAKVMGQMARAGLLDSHRGAGGGFALALPLHKITIAAMVEAVDGPIALTNCIDNAPGDCSLESICSMRPHWQVINGAVRSALCDITLHDITQPVQAAPKPRMAALTTA